jgi:hypothetical protein
MNFQLINPPQGRRPSVKTMNMREKERFIYVQHVNHSQGKPFSASHRVVQKQIGPPFCVISLMDRRKMQKRVFWS